MPFFTRTFVHPNPSFIPVFRLLDELESYSREVQAPVRHRHERVFNPRFDVRETEGSYELYGELPGVDRDNIRIEFTDPQTLVIRGRVERSYTAGTPPAESAAVEAAPEPKAVAAAAESTEQPASPAPSHKATVEDDDEDYVVADAKGEEAIDTPATTVAEPVTEEKPAPAVQQQKPQESKDRFWLSERSVGHFSRTFNFANRVEAEAVAANLNNGVLTVSIPKSKKYESRRIAIN